MKKWTIVIEVTDDENVNEPEVGFLSGQEIADAIISSDIPSALTYRIMETIEAPYGPQHKDGVYLDTREGPRKVQR